MHGWDVSRASHLKHGRELGWADDLMSLNGTYAGLIARE